jgi:hypothetical protein
VTKRFFPLILFVFVIAACTEATVLPTATLTPTLPTPSLTPTSQTRTPQPFTTTTPVIVIENPNLNYTPTPEPLPISLPKEKIAILRPAAGSNVTSPMRVNGYAGPSWNNRVELRLIGEDGQLITRTIAYLLALPGNAGPFTVEMNFETTMLAEKARLEASTFSKDDTKLEHMASVDLILLSIGAPLVHWTIHGPEQLTIISPQEYQIISGGTVSVNGVGWVSKEGPLYVDVLDRDGNVVGGTQVEIDSNGPGMAGPFEVEIEYQIAEAQRGRIAIYEESQSIPGIIHYASIIVNLRP